jgi:hypothetical protein
MNTKPLTDEEWIIHAINIHGFFFESICRKSIADCTGWRIVDTNYPVSFPPPNGPLKGNESTLDIRAELKTAEMLLTLLIECKKRNKNFVNWIFFPKPRSSSDYYQPVTRQIVNTLIASSSAGWTPDLSLHQVLSMNMIAAEEARETRGSYKASNGDDKTKTANDSITGAAYQVALATQSLVIEELGYSDALGKKSPPLEMPYKTQIFLPVVLTNAKLFTCDYNPGDIDPLTGEIPLDKARITSQPYLFYEYPLPPHLQTSPKDLATALEYGLMRMFKRLDILVVNIEELPSLLTSFATIFHRK